MEGSIAYHCNNDSPCKLGAAAMVEMENDPGMMEIYHKVNELN